LLHLPDMAQRPEAEGTPVQIDIPNLNIWRWQAERVGTRVAGPIIGHHAARFFDNLDTVNYQSPSSSTPTGTPPLSSFLAPNVEVKRDVAVRRGVAAHISDYRLLQAQLGQISIDRIGNSPDFGDGPGLLRSDALKEALTTALDLTADGFIRTMPHQHPEGLRTRRLAATVLGTDFSLGRRD
jgi:hypothetical protein